MVRQAHHDTRLRWIDLLRSAAIAGMIVYHTAYDLQMFYDWDLDVTRGSWKLFQIGIASLFLVVSGISASFWTEHEDRIARGWRRGWTILSAAMLVSLATAIVDPATWVRFGILHLIALAAFILPFLRRLHPLLIALLGIACIALTPFDLMPMIASVDYTPPIPWIGPVLLGFAVGLSISERGLRRAPGGALLEYLSWPGRHSLWIYLVHQPIILAILWIVS